MAGDWIKMRGSLGSHPRVLRIAALIESSPDVGKHLSTGFNGSLDEIVTRDVTRDVTLASLLRVWCAANEHTSDGVWHGLKPSDLDHIAGVPGFGQAMEMVGWAVYDETTDTTTLPGFLEHNAPAKGGRGSAAARQKRYRERHKDHSNSDANRDVTRDVTQTVTSDVEKRREEKSNNNLRVVSDTTSFSAFWQAWPQSPRKVAKSKCAEVWKRRQLDPITDQIVAHVAASRESEQWRGGFEPAPLTYLNQRRWEDGNPDGGKSGLPSYT